MKKIFLFLCFVAAFSVRAEKVQLSIHFLSGDQVADINFDKDDFLEYAKTFTSSLTGFLEAGDEKRDVLVLLTLTKENNPAISIYARPALDKKTTDQLLKKLKSAGKIKSRLVKYDLLFMAKVNGGPDNSTDKFEPAFMLPGDAEKEAMKNADMAGKIVLIKKWTREFAIPVLAAFENKVEEKFEGVRAMGKLLSVTDFSKPQNVASLTDHNSNYWRAMAEMAPGNLIIPVSKIAMHVANGEFDHAQNYMEMVTLFSDDKSYAKELNQEFTWRLNMFTNELNGKIEKGLNKHDMLDYDGAIQIYEEVLKIYPQSSWAQYELYYSQSAKRIEKDSSALNDFSQWETARINIFASNPMYPMEIHATNGKEGYLMFRRQSISSLFKEENELIPDLVRYTDIAFDLGNYAMAAHMYWFIFSSFPKEKYDSRNLLEYFLYCLDKLGDKQMAGNFKGDHSEEFKKIEHLQKEAMESNSVYQSFIDK